MKTLVSSFKSPRILRIALLLFMLSTFPHLFGTVDVLSQCPLGLDCEATLVEGTYTIGSSFLFNYTISIDTDHSSEYDSYRIYSLNCDYFSTDKDYGSFRMVSSDRKDGETVTYPQFPVTGQFIVMYCGGVGSPVFDLIVRGTLLKAVRILPCPLVVNLPGL